MAVTIVERRGARRGEWIVAVQTAGRRCVVWACVGRRGLAREAAVAYCLARRWAIVTEIARRAA
jgi:hypothetical protein